MNLIGALELRLLADLAQLRKDMSDAKGMVSNAADSMTGAFNGVKNALAAVGVSLSVGAFANWIKSGIDAGDAMKAFSQKTGVAVKDVAGLQLAFKQGGMESETLGKAMSALQKNMAAGGGAFDTLGIKTRDAKGNMLPLKDVLYQSADALASVTGANERAVLAVQLFDKAGKEILPIFEKGSDGLKEMAEMADKLGLSMDGEAADAADNFNDTLELVGLSTQGVARQVGAQLLPALNGIVAGFIDFITEGDRVKKMADFIATGLKLLYSAGVALVEIFSAVGKTVGAAMAQIVAVMSGDIKGAIAIGKEWAANMKDDIAKAIKNVGDVWEETGSQTVAAVAKTTRVMRDVKIATDAQKDAQKDAARITKEAAKDFEKAQKEKEKLIKDEMDLQSKRAIAVIAAYEKEQQAVDDSITKADEMVAAILRETEALGMSNTEREISNALLALEKAGLEKGTYAYEVYAEKIRAAVLDKAAVTQSIEQSKQIADNWNNLTKEIGQGLTDSLFRAFESGKSFFKTLWDGIVNTFKTTVLRLAINAVINPVNAAVGSLLGGGSSLASASTGGGGVLGMLSSGGSLLGSIGGSLGAFGTAAGYGASALFGGTGLTALSGGASMIGAGSLASGAGMIAGVLGPIAAAGAALYAIYNAFKHERTPHTGGAAVSTAAGGTGSSWLQASGFERRFDLSPDVERTMVDLTTGVAGMLQTLSDISGGGKIRVGAGYADDSSKDPAWGAFDISAGGKSLVSWGAKRFFKDGEEGYKQFVKDMASSTKTAIDKLNLPKWARSIADAFGDAPSSEEINLMVGLIVKRNQDLKTVSEVLRNYGGIFAGIAGASEDARSALLDLMGGIEGLTAAAAGFVGSYYTPEEQMAIAARQVVDVLTDAGIDPNGLSSKSDYRALLESIDPTEANMPAIAAMLKAAPAFAQIADFLSGDGGGGRNLMQLASLMPDISFLRDLAAAAGPLNTGAGGVAGPTGDALTGPTSPAPGSVVAGPTGPMYPDAPPSLYPDDPGALTAGASSTRVGATSLDVDDMSEAITDAIAALQTKLEAALTSIASATAGTQRVLSGWSDGDAVATRAAT